MASHSLRARAARALPRLTAGGLLIAGLAGSPLAAGGGRAGDITIQDPWARASLGDAPNSAVYMTLETSGEPPDRLVASSTPVADKAELHSHAMDGGIARMRPVEAVEVAPGAPTVLEPGGLHIMLIGLRQKLAAGDRVPLTLVFERAGEVTIEAPVRAMASTGGDSQHGATGAERARTH